MSPARVVFWAIFTVSGVWLQSFMPGLDFFAPGLVLCFQEEDTRAVVALAVLWLLLQEGMGSLAFGTGILWYGILAALFFFGHWLFEAKNFVFMIILGVCLGVMHFALTQIMAQLQDWLVSPGRVMMESLLQAVVFPVQWGLIYIIYSHLEQNGQDV
jgi:hypothetical protein